MIRFQKIYLEITNRCNLRCAFCPGTKRTPAAMSREEFAALLEGAEGPETASADAVSAAESAPPAQQTEEREQLSLF